ncbi:MAG: hypothetical protein IVW57_11600 [Ktedonobacterales bacterium]|nr:hypothetical protein [Ktedonobacterales bacterium]
MRPVGDQKYVFIMALAISWLLLIGLPISISVWLGNPALGLPLLGVVVWFALLRVARWLSPPVRADARIRRGNYAAAIALSDRALAVRGRGAWIGPRRLIWLNRRVAALLALGRAEEALVSALEAVTISADPETLGNCAAALLWLNRYEEAAGAARLTLSLTRERSVSANATLAAVMLARGKPAEAEALARASLTDIETLLPLMHPEHHVACLAALCRAERMQGNQEAAEVTLTQLRRMAGRRPDLRAIALAEVADSVSTTSTERDRAFALLDQARALSSRYVAWYLEQPGTLESLYDDQRLPLLAAATKAPQLHHPPPPAPGIAQVAMTLAAAQRQGTPRPAPQSSRGALVTQLLTLSGTIGLLIWWAVRFYLTGT